MPEVYKLYNAAVCEACGEEIPSFMAVWDAEELSLCRKCASTQETYVGCKISCDCGYEWSVAFEISPGQTWDVNKTPRWMKCPMCKRERGMIKGPTPYDTNLPIMSIDALSAEGGE